MIKGRWTPTNWSNDWFLMVALWNRAHHYIFALRFLLSLSVIKTTKMPFVGEHVHHKSKTADGCHLGKIKTLPYLSNGLTDRREIWQWHILTPRLFPALKFPYFENPRWRLTPSWKIAISQQQFNWSTWKLARWHILTLLTLPHPSGVASLFAAGGGFHICHP